MDTQDKVKKFLESDKKDGKKIIDDYIQNIDSKNKEKHWSEYFGIENKDRKKFWEKLNGLDENDRKRFLKSARHLTNNEKIDLYNKTPKEFQVILSKILVPKLPTKPTKKASKPLITIITIYLTTLIIANLVFLLPIVTTDIPKEENILIYNMTSQIALDPSDHTVTYDFGVLEGESFDIDAHFIFLVVSAGSLGALIHGLAKISQNTQDGKVNQRDSLWYFSRPFLGAALAIAVYMTLRGGLLTTSNIEILNPYGIAALAIIVGLSTKQVTQKLKDLLESVFPTKKNDESTGTT